MFVSGGNNGASPFRHIPGENSLSKASKHFNKRTVRQLENVRARQLGKAYGCHGKSSARSCSGEFKGSRMYQALRASSDRVRSAVSSVLSLDVKSASSDDIRDLASTISSLSSELMGIAQESGNTQSETAAGWLDKLADRVVALDSERDIDTPLESSDLADVLAGHRGTIDGLSDQLAEELYPSLEVSQRSVDGLVEDFGTFSSLHGASDEMSRIINELEGGEEVTAGSGSFDPVSISNVEALSGRDYQAGARLEVGQEVYTDRGYTFTNVAGYEGATMIQTANDDKNSESGNFLSFELGEAATVYVAFDQREGDTSEWLQDFEATDDYLQSTDYSAQLRVHKKEFGPGEVTVGGTEMDSWNRSNYVVFATAEAAVVNEAFDDELLALHKASHDLEGESLSAFNRIMDEALGSPDAMHEELFSVYHSLTQISERLSMADGAGDMQDLAQETFTRLNNLIGHIQEMDGSEEGHDLMQSRLGVLDAFRTALEPHVARSDLADQEKKVPLEVVANEMETITQILSRNPGGIELQYSGARPVETAPESPTSEPETAASAGQEILRLSSDMMNLNNLTIITGGDGLTAEAEIQSVVAMETLTGSGDNILEAPQ